MTSTTYRRCAAAALAAGLLGTATAGPALASPSTFKPKLGTYKGREATGQKFQLVVGPCSQEGKALCIYTPGHEGTAGDIELICTGINGGSDGDDLFSGFGPANIGKGKVSRKNTDIDPFNGAKETVAYSFALSTKGTIKGMGRISETFTNGSRCDSGPVKLNAKR